MPVVHFYHPELISGKMDDIKIALSEFIPLVLNSEMGPLQPGDVAVYTHTVYSNRQPILEIEARDYPDRDNLDQRALWLKNLLQTIGLETHVWIKPVKAGGAFIERLDDEEGGKVNMDEESAMERYKNRTNRKRCP